MNIILCVIAASILFNVAKSGKSLEEETEEMKTMLEQFKVKLESMKHKVPDHPQLHSNFDTAVADAAKFIETLKASLKVFEQLRKEEAERKTPKGKLKFVKEKLPEVITTLNAYKSEAKPRDSYVHTALRFAGELNEALEAALKVQDKSMDIEKLRKKAVALKAMTYNIGLYVKDAEHPEKGKELQESVYRIALEFKKTLEELQV